MAVSDWSTDPAQNTTVGPVNIAENCPAANMNNMGREIMAQIKAWADGLGDSYQVKDATLTAFAALTFAANKMLYATGADTFATADLTPFARTILDDANATAACLTLGAVRVAALSLANPGYIRFQVEASQYIQIAWGSFTAAGNGYTSPNYATEFPNASFPVCSGTGEISGTAQDNGPAVTSASRFGFTAWNATNSPCTTWYVAVGY